MISNTEGRGGRRTAPYAFTEQGVAMLSTVLGSPRAIAVNIEIMRTFVRVRALAATHGDLAKRLAELEDKTEALAMNHETFSRIAGPQLRADRPSAVKVAGLDVHTGSAGMRISKPRRHENGPLEGEIRRAPHASARPRGGEPRQPGQGQQRTSSSPNGTVLRTDPVAVAAPVVSHGRVWTKIG